MLTTSPRIPSSVNASPSAFHYAVTLSSQPSSSSSRPLARSSSTSRRSSKAGLSTGPMTSPSLLRQQQQPQMQTQTQTQAHTQFQKAAPSPRQHAAVDASTQRTSATDPAASPAPDRPVVMRPQNSAASTSSQPPSQPPPTPRPQSSDPAAATSTATATAQAEPSTPSPGKRRKSQGASTTTQGDSTTEDSNASPSSKRQRPTPAPQKILPKLYEHCPGEDIVFLISHMLSELIETNDALALRSGNLTRFHSRTAPSISVLEYLNRLAKHATLTPPLLLSMVYYIDRLCALYPEFTINTLTVHRFLITAATVAAKGLSDSFWNNTTYARVGGVRVAELKLLELEFLYRVDWKIVPNPEVLVAYYRGLVERCPSYTFAEGEEPDEDSTDSAEVSDDAMYEDSEESLPRTTSATGSPIQDSGRG